MSNQTPPIDLSQFGPIPTGSTGTTTAVPTAIGAAKYDTVGGAFVYEGTKYQRVIQGANGDYFAIDRTGAVMVDDKGAPIKDTPKADKTGNPIRVQASYQVPGAIGTEKAPSAANYGAGLTSRIDPNSPAATGGTLVTGQPGALGPSRYDQGAETRIFGNMPVELRVQVEQAMLDKGIAPTGSAGNGEYTPAWLNAFSTILGYANNNNQTWEDALAAMPKVTRVGQIAPKAYEYSLHSPEDLAAIYKKAAASLIGGGSIPQSDIDSYVRAYQELERQDAQKSIAAKEAIAAAGKTNVVLGPDGQPIPITPGATGTPGTDILGSLPDSAAGAGTAGLGGPPAPIINENVAPPSPEQVAAEQIKSKYAGRFGATNMANAYGLFVNAMRGLGSGSAPSTQGTVA